MVSKPASRRYAEASQYPEATVYEDRETLSQALIAHIDHIARASLAAASNSPSPYQGAPCWT